jgi:hypothetical protein
MKEATVEDKGLIIDILSNSFQENLSVNYLIPQDSKRQRRIRALMDYSFETCRLFGKVYLSEDRSGCALISFPEQKKITLKSLWLEAKMILLGIGPGNISKAISREREISRNYPHTPIYYLWFIGVNPDNQSKGVGKGMMAELLAESRRMGRDVYLETSTLKNLPWYRKFGLEVYRQLSFGYDLFLIRSNGSKD